MLLQKYINEQNERSNNCQKRVIDVFFDLFWLFFDLFDATLQPCITLRMNQYKVIIVLKCSNDYSSFVFSPSLFMSLGDMPNFLRKQRLKYFGSLNPTL